MNMWLLNITKPAFFIYLITELGVLLCESIYFFNPTEKNSKLYLGSLFYYYPATFAAQLLLCAVLYEYRVREEVNSTVSEDAQLKAHFWNSYVDADLSTEYLISSRAVQ